MEEIEITANQASTPEVIEDPKPRQKDLPLRVLRPIRWGDGIQAYVTYEVHMKEHKVVRRYSDFLWLHEKLEEEFLDILIPPVPEKVIVAKFTPETVEYRRSQLEKFLNRVVSHPKLKDSQFLRPFLNASESEMTKHRARKYVNPKRPEKGFLDATTSFFGVLAARAIEPAQEPDAQFAEHKAYFDNLHNALEALQQASDTRLSSRTTIVEDLVTLAQAATVVSDVEHSHDKVLSQLWNTYARILKDVAKVQAEMVRIEKKSLDYCLRDQYLLSEAAQKLLENRFSVVERLQEATQKNSASAATLGSDLQETSTKALEEIESYKAEKTTEVKEALETTVEGNIWHHQKSVAYWKELLNELEEVKHL